METEIWKDIPWYEWKYQVSNLWRLKSMSYKMTWIEKILDIKPNKNWYTDYKLSKNNSYKRYRINRLVALNFIPNPENKPQVNHIDWNKLNNRVDNLEWVTAKENIQHAWNNWLIIVSVINPFIINHPWKKKVWKYNSSLELINIFDSAKEASTEIWIHKQNISDCCRGKKKHIRGFIYKYI